MDIDARIKRRQRRQGGPRLIQEYEALSPVAHIDEPSDRGPVFERLLDHLDPVFEGSLPPNGYVWGPMGAGKSAIVTALFSRLESLSTERRSIIHTSTRAAVPPSPGFVYVDLRETTSPFAFYHRILDGLVDDAVPEHGISTTELESRLRDIIEESGPGVVIAIDHVDDPSTQTPAALVELLAGLPSTVSWLAIGRSEPSAMALTEYTARTIEIEPYRRQMLVDVLMTRASTGLVPRALTHDLAREVADWATGNAHDGLAALFVAADAAAATERTRLTEADVTAAMEEIPTPSVSLARVLALPANKQAVLRQLVDLDPPDRASVSATADAIASAPAVDLSAGTITRFLYEMAEAGIVERVQTERDDRKGRPPSRVDLRFSPTAFRRLYDLDQ